MKKSQVLLASGLLLSAASSANTTPITAATDKVLFSQQPPASLPANMVPQFVTLGFDDNSEADGINWTLQTLAGLKNPAGLGSAATFDGQPLKASFFPTCRQAEQNPAILTAWNQIYLQGHEIGNHTYAHEWGQNFSQQQWESQMQGCMTLLSAPFKAGDASSGAGVPREQIQGFRAPFVLYNDDTFKAMKTVGLSYDVSIQEGNQADQDTSNYFWPYTLDEGSPGSQLAWWGPNVSKHPGVWSLPLHMLQVVPDDRVAKYGLNYSLLNKIHETLKKFNFKGNKLTAFDFNLYSSGDWLYALTKAEALAVLKYNLDARLAGNRAPLVLGFHTDYLSGSAIANMNATSPQDRRDVVKEFLEYAVTIKAVRVVRHIDVINWMRQPTKLVVCADNEWDFQAVYTAGDTVSYQGHLWTAKWWTKLEMPIAKSWSVWKDEGQCS
ncbi:MAG: peptidoglycan/xylan/chitin deacetylase (PgdA/CDA1 family) [Phenylobacterium sp.]|jgi:peptidoglycan/xylan/chitin deacetylase (PgdA/CDA1 family)